MFKLQFINLVESLKSEIEDLNLVKLRLFKPEDASNRVEWFLKPDLLSHPKFS